MVDEVEAIIRTDHSGDCAMCVSRELTCSRSNSGVSVGQSQAEIVRQCPLGHVRSPTPAASHETGAPQ